MMVSIICANRNSGKTTFANNLISKDSSKYIGFLSLSSPNKDSFYLYDINTHDKIVLMSEKINVNYERIGRFYIEPFAFEKAYDSLLNQVENDKEHRCVVLDEIGQLELNGKGFDNLMEKLIDLNVDLLLCIRVDFVDSVIKKYGIKNYSIIEVPKIDKKK